MTSDKGPHLGHQVVGSALYDPELLFPVPRATARSSLPSGGFQGFGEDIWHAYELSWLDARGIPQIYVGRFSIPASSPNIVESKSLKLYLNSLNNHRFNSRAEALGQICRDVSAVVGVDVGLKFGEPTGDFLASVPLGSADLGETPGAIPETPSPSQLARIDGDDHVHTHRLRSLCPVTAQPDWATVVIETRGSSVDRAGLLAYLLAYRNHQEFHEQCVERIFTDIQTRVAPAYLSVHALYTRRGGLDICPWRCSEDQAAPHWRLDRQ